MEVSEELREQDVKLMAAIEALRRELASVGKLLSWQAHLYRLFRGAQEERHICPLLREGAFKGRRPELR
ncbi:MAG: hypothetical protein DRN99_04440 [Thermoproteota archaeon]|nr:MAG: hypothetical protein DRN99_04440 [Candidatus Korarchaeota archaeon]